MSLPSHLEKLEQKLADEKKDVFLLDGYIFSGLSDELKQRIVVVASGRQDVAERTGQFFSGLEKTIYFIEGEFGSSSKIKLANDLLESIHFVASIEAMFLGVRAGIHLSIIYDIISNAAGNSRIFVEVVPKLLSEDHLLIYSLKSSLQIYLLSYMHAIKFQVSKVKWKRLLLIQVSRSRWPLGTLDIHMIKDYPHTSGSAVGVENPDDTLNRIARGMFGGYVNASVSADGNFSSPLDDDLALF